VQVVLFGVLCFIAHGEWQQQGPCDFYWSSVERPVFAQIGDEAGFLPPCRTPKAEEVAIALNLPAVFTGAILGAGLVLILHRQGDVWWVLSSIPMVAVLWYWVGWWIDRRLGFFGLLKHRFRLPSVLTKAAQGFSVVMIFLSAFVMFGALLYHHHRLDEYLVVSSFLFWSVFLFEVTWPNPRRHTTSTDGEGPFPV
jgi:hypothetical protein